MRIQAYDLRLYRVTWKQRYTWCKGWIEHTTTILHGFMDLFMNRVISQIEMNGQMGFIDKANIQVEEL
jgi:hypothetical protein